MVEAISREGENDALGLAKLAGIMTYSLANGLSPLMPPQADLAPDAVDALVGCVRSFGASAR